MRKRDAGIDEGLLGHVTEDEAEVDIDSNLVVLGIHDLDTTGI